MDPLGRIASAPAPLALQTVALEDLEVAMPKVGKRDRGNVQSAASPALSLRDVLLKKLEGGPFDFQELVLHSGFDENDVLETLVGLEADGIVKSLPGDVYALESWQYDPDEEQSEAIENAAAEEKPQLPVLGETEVVDDTQEEGLKYPELKITECSVTSEHGPLTVEEIRQFMGWETESQFKARMVQEKGGKPDDWTFGDDYHCLNEAKEKVYCWNNGNNRALDIGWAEEIRHMILAGQWAGPHTLPGETVNGETCRISRKGQVLSAQHQFTGCVLADERLLADRKRLGDDALSKYPTWKGHDHVFLETIIITGVSDDERVLRTIDYVKPRTLADVLYTGTSFRDKSQNERKEMTRMLSSAIELLWNRTDTKGYKTHPELVAFLERHRRLLECVEHLFELNKSRADGLGRKISKLRLSAGQCSGVLYIMGSSGPKTDGDKYRNESPPTERGLDWSYWDKALSFWKNLCGEPWFEPVRKAIYLLTESDPTNEDNLGLGGRTAEKLAIVCKAWDKWKDHAVPDDGAPFTSEDLEPDGLLSLAYTDIDDKGKKMPDGQLKLVDQADFGGIDLPSALGASANSTSVHAPPMPPAPTEAQIEKLKEEALARRTSAKKGG